LNGWKILAHLSSSPVPDTMSRYRENPLYDQFGGKSIRWRQLEPGWPMPVPSQIFTGPVVMLIDARTFSAGEDTAAAFKLMKRGKIVGTPDGGSTGQPLMFDLPGGGTARICVKRDSYPDGTDFVGVGVLPDVRVAPTIDDVRRGRDAALTAALAAMR